MPSDAAIAQDWVEILEVVKARRLGVSVEQARPIVAREAGIPSGRLYSLRRGRLKDVWRDKVILRLGNALVNELQVLLRQVEHDLQIRSQIGEDPRSGEIQALLASRQKIREALGLTAAPPKDGGGV